MARQSANSLLNSLKGKIWLATSALALFICTFGLLSYMAVSFIVTETFYAVFVPFLFLSFSVMVFGWWLSNEVVGPIERVSLLAKSLERSSLTSLPKTSGSVETDELLQTLHRNSQQLQNITGLMEAVANGKTDVALASLQTSDRLSNSFQKLLSRVAESVDAKQDFKNLEAAVGQLTEEILRIRKGDLDAEIKVDFAPTKEISETLKFLIRHLNELISQIRNDSRQAQVSAAHVRLTIQNLIHDDKNRAQEMNQAATTLKQMPNSVQKISEELSASIASANQSIEKVRRGTEIAQENLTAVSGLRKQVNEAIRRVQELGDRSKEIGKVAKTVEDLSHRTSLIALNASIQAVEASDKPHGFSVLAEEVERLSQRAENTNREISSLNKSINLEIGEVESSLHAAAQKAANLSKFAIETDNSLNELERYVGQSLSLQSKLADYSREHASESEKSFRIFLESISVTEKSVNSLKESEAGIAGFSSLMDKLQLATSDFKLAKEFEDENSSPAKVAETDKYGEFAQNAASNVAA